MLKKVTEWLDNLLKQDIPDDVVAFCFNLYEDGNNHWSMELVGAASFDEEDSDWACDEIVDLGTREKPFVWEKDAEWDVVLDEIIDVLKLYLGNGTCAEILKNKAGVGAGFVDGDIEILYMR